MIRLKFNGFVVAFCQKMMGYVRFFIIDNTQHAFEKRFILYVIDFIVHLQFTINFIKVVSHYNSIRAKEKNKHFIHSFMQGIQLGSAHKSERQV